MKLIEFSYDDGTWKLENLRLKDVNLLVGRNAVGKSRTLRAINSFYRLIGIGTWTSGKHWQAKFVNDKGFTIEYSIEIDNDLNVIKNELITVNNEVFLSRKFNKKEEISIAEIKSEVTGDKEEIYPSNDTLVLHTTRNTKHYSFLGNLINWAENSFGFTFGHGNFYTFSQNGFHLPELITIENSPVYFKKLEEQDRQIILSELNQLGYNFSKIHFEERPVPTIYLLEEGVNEELSHFHLSQGLTRSLSILIYLQFLISKEKPATILIDDLCEGLDYERAIKLGKLIFEKCKDSNIQLIATTNDNFIMDVVDIKHWNLLTREGSTVSAMNYDTHRQLFDDFRLTGLSNFDFFSSDYLQQKLW